MPRLRVLKATGATPTTPALRVMKISGTGPVAILTPRLRVFKTSGVGVVPVTPRLRVLRAVGAGSVSLVLNPLTNRSGVEPESTVTITATVAAGQPDSWTWRQISGPTVTLLATSSVASFTAPSAMTAVTVVLGVVASSASVVSTERTISIQVLPQTDWTYVAGTWRGSRSQWL